MRTSFVMGCGAAAFIVALAACGGDSTSPDAGTTVLFEDNFSSGNLSKWIVIGGDPAVDASEGNTAPSVFLFKAVNASPGDALRASTNFTPNGGLTFTAQVLNHATAGEGQLTLRLMTSNGSNTCQAGAQIQRTRVLYENTNGFSRPMANNPITADNAWHTYTLIIGTDGAMTWYRDGSIQLSSAAYSGCTASTNVLSLELSGGGTPDESNGNIDNVRITRP